MIILIIYIYMYNYYIYIYLNQVEKKRPLLHIYSTSIFLLPWKTSAIEFGHLPHNLYHSSEISDVATWSSYVFRMFFPILTRLYPVYTQYVIIPINGLLNIHILSYFGEYPILHISPDYPPYIRYPWMDVNGPLYKHSLAIGGLYPRDSSGHFWTTMLNHQN